MNRAETTTTPRNPFSFLEPFQDETTPRRGYFTNAIGPSPTSSTTTTTTYNSLPSISSIAQSETEIARARIACQPHSSPQTTSTRSLSSVQNDDNIAPPPPPPNTHLVVSSDTLAGLCLYYRVTSQQAWQRANPTVTIGSHSGLQLAVPVGHRIVVPRRQNQNANDTVQQQDTTTLEYQVAAVVEQCPYLTVAQAERYVLNQQSNVLSLSLSSFQLIPFPLFFKKNTYTQLFISQSRQRGARRTTRQGG